MLNEMAETVGKEFDFRREARLMDTVRSRLQDCSLAVKIPQPVHSMTTTNLLVMQRMQGGLSIISNTAVRDTASI